MLNTTTPPTLSKGGRSIDFAGTRIRCEAFRDVESTVELMEWLQDAIALKQQLVAWGAANRLRSALHPEPKEH